MVLFLLFILIVLIGMAVYLFLFKKKKNFALAPRKTPEFPVMPITPQETQRPSQSQNSLSS